MVCDGRLRLPVRTGVADVLLNVFAPRNGAEMRRILRDDGTLLVVSPTERHLRELRTTLALLAVDPAKQDRIEQQLGPHFTPLDSQPLELAMRLGHADIEHLVLMGPNAFHADPAALRDRIRQLASDTTVTASVTIAAYRPRR